MDFLFPSDDAIEKMSAEFAKLRSGRNFHLEDFDAYAIANKLKAVYDSEAEAIDASHDRLKNVYGLEAETVEASSLADKKPAIAATSREAHYNDGAPLILTLYFAFVLGYNLGHGNAIHDANRGLGGVQSCEGPSGDLNNFFRRN